MSKLTKQKGLLKCSKCIDDMTVERRPAVIGQILGVGDDMEGVDMRVIDRAFFDEAENEELV